MKIRTIIAVLVQVKVFELKPKDNTVTYKKYSSKPESYSQQDNINSTLSTSRSKSPQDLKRTL